MYVLHPFRNNNHSNMTINNVCSRVCLFLAELCWFARVLPSCFDGVQMFLWVLIKLVECN